MKTFILTLSLLLGSAAFADGQACVISVFDISVNGSSNCPAGAYGYVVSGPEGAGNMFINDNYYCGGGANDPHDVAYKSARAYAQAKVDAKICTSVDDQTGN